MPPVEVVDGTEIIPTGGKGDVSVTVERIKNYVYAGTNFTALASQLQTVDLRSQSNKTAIDSHVANLVNPHQVTKAQVGLGNVDNTSDVDKPLSTAAQTAITNLTNTKADVTYIDSLLASKANITYVDSGLATKLNTTANAVSASKLETARSISVTGDATWTTSFDGSANVTAALTLANSGVVANTYGSSTTVPVITIDAKGRTTSANTATIPTSSTTTSGLVQLNDTTSSTSNTLAATANSVKTTYDLATTANTTANAAIPSSQKAVANGVATLDTNALIPTAQLPTATTTDVGVTQLNNTLTSTSATQALTAAQGKALNDKMFGVGQTYQDVTASRALGTTYTNSTNKDIWVSVTVGLSAGATLAAYVNGYQVCNGFAQQSSSQAWAGLLVPPGGTYSVSGSSIVKWMERK